MKKVSEKTLQLSQEFRLYTKEWFQRVCQITPTDEIEPLILQIHQQMMERLYRDLPILVSFKDRIHLYVLRKLPSGPTIKELSNELGYTEKYCSTLIVTHLGESFSNYVMRIRIEAAQGHLADSGLSIGYIPCLLGFQ